MIEVKLMDDKFIQEKNEQQKNPEEESLASLILTEEDFDSIKTPQTIERSISELMKGGLSLHEAIRDIVFTSTHEDGDNHSTIDDEEFLENSVQQKQAEMIETLENLDQEFDGMSIKEVSALFASLVDMQSQLCIQKTDGVITIRMHLKHFFNMNELQLKESKFWSQEITLLFTPEEVSAVRRKLLKIDETHPLYDFYNIIIDQASDSVQYTEMTGQLLYQMSKFFICKLEYEGYEGDAQTLDFKERHYRTINAYKRTLNSLKKREQVVLKHLRNHDILTELPKLFRTLIYIRLGIVGHNHLEHTIKKIRNSLGKYARAKGAVEIDFRNYDSELIELQRIYKHILNLHQDILGFTSEIFEKEFQSCLQELHSLMEEIESSSEKLDPNSPEYQDLLQKKVQVSKQLEERRKKLDIVKSQSKLIDIKEQLVSEKIERFDRNDDEQERIQQELQKVKLERVLRPTAGMKLQKSSSRMVTTRSRTDG